MSNPFRQYYGHDNPFECLCRKYVISSILYYLHDTSPWPDTRYDNACNTLRMSYKKLPAWFTDRVTYADLCAGTGFTLKPTPEEQEVCEGFLSGRYDMDKCF